MNQLDGLRAIAVVGVVLCHTLDPERHPWSQHGAFGVQLFFVLSGFLITRILIDARNDAEQLAEPKGRVLTSFYARRALRIFPIYYVTLLVAAVIGVEGMRGDLGWNLAYLSNWDVAFDGQFGAVTHVWSLAVEEQFYLLWPLVVLFAPRQVLPWMIGLMIAVALTNRVLLTVATDLWSDGIAILTPSVLDSLGLGALLAVLWRATKGADRAVDLIGVLAIALGLIDVAVRRWGPPRSGIAAFTVVWWSLAFCWLVHCAASERTGVFGRVLTFRPLAYLGTISYGVYLFHLFVVPVAAIIERNTTLDMPVPVERGPAQFVVVIVASVSAAAFSWTVFERPINSRKHRFPYVTATPTVTYPSAYRDVHAVNGKGDDGDDAHKS
jgi:peptidoglycan/LPS O-acetylase OafA/YrhL